MTNKYLKRGLIFGIIMLFIGASFIPTISSTSQKDVIQRNENEIFTNEFYAEITKPIRALYLNDKKIWEFRLIQRGFVIGDITIEVNATDDEFGIHYVEFYIDGTLQDTDSESPYAFLWDFWMPGIHVLGATAYNTEGESVDAEEFQVFKLG
ncbi:MAG: hypothetical protein KAR64_02055 [Thermoplasmatales archaeon]|nr:hypothetical protein [Thermoplasmatales archaeon]